LSVEDAPDGGARLVLECGKDQQDPARVLLDEVRAAIQRKTEPPGKAT
jgi:hypothetical protein